MWTDPRRIIDKGRELRAFCPCAACQGHHGPIAYVPVEGLGDEAFVLTDLGPAGQYALRMSWGDGHTTGIYRFSFLRALGALYGEADVRDRTFSHDT